MLNLYPAESSDMQERSSVAAAETAVLRAEGHLAESLAAGLKALRIPDLSGLSYQQVKQAFVHAIEAAFALGRMDEVERLLGLIDSAAPGQRPPYLAAHSLRFHGRLAGSPERYAEAEGVFGELGIPFWVAVTQLEHAGDVGGDEGERLRASARATFEQLGATVWLERAGAIAVSS